MPVKNLTALAAFRYTHEEKDSFATFLDTNTTANVAPFSPPTRKAVFIRIPNPTPREGDSSDEFDNLAETFELRYNGIENWALLCPGRLDRRIGQRQRARNRRPERPGNAEQGHGAVRAKIHSGINWYPMAGLNFATQYYHKSADYDNDFKNDCLSPPPSRGGAKPATASPGMGHR